MPFPQSIDMTGRVFGELPVIERAGSIGRGRAVWLCECDCGARVIVSGTRLREGHRRVCAERRHVPPRHRLTWNSWTGMRRRCADAQHARYRYYGGRGIRGM